MNVLKKTTERRILESATEPANKAWLWLHTVDGKTSLKQYVNGSWTAIINGLEDKIAPVTPATTSSGGDVDTSQFVKSEELDKLIAEYVKKSELGDVATKSDVEGINDNLINIATLAQQADTAANDAATKVGNLEKKLTDDYQPKLTAGDNVKIEDNVISVEAEGVTVDSTLNAASYNAVANAPVTTKLNEVKAAVDGKIGKGTLATINGHNLEAGGNYTISGGTGGASVAVVEEVPDDPDDSTVYFFSHSRSQGVGSYNTLLQEGQVTLDDGTVHKYHPSVLYHVYPDGSFAVVEDNDEDNKIITFDNNIVYCYGQRTTMERYGSVYVSNTVKYAETMTTAYFSVGINGPFFAKETVVTVSYNEGGLVQSENRFTLYRSIKGTDGTHSRWVAMKSGDKVVFTYDDFFNGMDLKLVRSAGINSQINRYETVAVAFNNGYEDVVVKVKYSKGTIFFKDGVCFNGFSRSKVNDDGTFTLSGNTTLAVATGYKCDLSKYNLMYAVVKSSNSTVILWDNSSFTNKGISDTLLLSTVIGTAGAYTNRGSKPGKNPKYELRSIGESVVANVISNCRIEGSYDFDLILKNSESGKSCAISELGIITYEAPTEDDYQRT